MMEMIINSSQNKFIKHVKSLHSKKNRDELHEYIVEGIKAADEALDYHAQIKYAVFDESIFENKEMLKIKKELLDRNINIYLIDRRLFKEIGETDTPQGIILVIEKTENLIDYDNNKSKIIILDNLKDPGNVGTIIRTADAFNMDGIILSKGCVDAYNGKTIRSTMGSIFHVPLIDNIELEFFLTKIKKKGFTIIGADPHASKNIFDLEKKDKTAIIIGSESHGISETAKKFIDSNFKIPMPGKAESLNASVAAALVMYELFLQLD